jgi:hypothetical protein
MTMNTRIARASAVVAAAALLGAATGAAAEPSGPRWDDAEWERAMKARSQALNLQHGLGGEEDPVATDAFAACATVGTPAGLERFLCYRTAANLANERRVSPVVRSGRDGSAPPARPIVMSGAGFDWPDAGIGFVAAAGIGLVGAGGAVAIRARRRDGRPG